MEQMAMGAGRRIENEPLLRRLGLTSDRPLPWLLLAVLWLAAFSIFPLLYAIYRSFFESGAGGFAWVGAANWLRLVEDPRIWNALTVTVTYAAIALAVELLLGMSIALLYDQDPLGVGVFRTIMVLPLVVPPAVTGLMFQLMEHSDFGVISYYAYKLGLLSPEEPFLGGTGRNAMGALLLPEIWQWTPFMALIILAGLKGLPRDVLEAAVVDGAGIWQRFRLIVLPMLRPVLGIAILLRVVDLFRVFDYVYILTGGGPGTRTEVASYYGWKQTFGFVNFGYGATIGVLLLIVLVVLGNLLIRMFRLKW